MTRSLVLIGLFVSIVSGLTIFYIIVLSGRITSGTYDLFAYFSNANGVIPDSSVKISGIKIGRVKSLKLEDGKAHISLEISKDIQIYSGDLLKKTAQGVLGSGFLEIVPKNTGHLLENGDQITNVESVKSLDKIISRSSDIADTVENITSVIDAYITKSGILQSISKIAQELEKTIQSIGTLSSELSTTVQVNTEAILQTTQAIALISREFETLLVHDKSEKNQDLSDTLIAIKNTLQNIEQITGTLTDGTGTIGKLLTDDTLYNNLEEASKNISNITNRAAGLATTFDYRFEGLFSEQGKFAAKNHINLRITPPDSPRYYQFGITHGGPSSIAGTNKYSSSIGNTKLKLNLMLAQNLFKNYLTIRGGLIENTGGFGLDIRPFKQWEISTEAFDFGKGAGAYLRAYTYIYPFLDPADKYNPLKWIYFGGGSDDILSSYRRTYFFGVGIRIQDEFIYDTIRLVPLAGSAATIAK